MQEETMPRATARASRFLLSVSAVALLAAAAALSAQADDRKGDDNRGNDNKFVPPATILHAFYDGVTNDLLTAGLGKTGLGSATAPGFADPLHPTAEELRRSAIYNNYRALVDPTPGGGYGTLYGPNVTADGTVTAGEGLIAGDEYISFAKGGGGRRNVTMMVQIPDSYDPSNGCIITAPSSGSRGVYGAIATAGEWGLKHGCAV